MIEACNLSNRPIICDAAKEIFFTNFQFWTTGFFITSKVWMEGITPIYTKHCTVLIKQSCPCNDWIRAMVKCTCTYNLGFVIISYKVSAWSQWIWQRVCRRLIKKNEQTNRDPQPHPLRLPEARLSRTSFRLCSPGWIYPFRHSRVICRLRNGTLQALTGASERRGWLLAVIPRSDIGRPRRGADKDSRQ